MKIKNYIKTHFFTFKTVEFFLIQFSKVLPFVKLLYPNKLHYKKGSIRRVKRKGILFELDISDYQEYCIYFNVSTDSSEVILNHLPKKDLLVLDVGANIGQSSLWMAQHLKNTHSKIIAFEPYPLNFKKMKRNVELNNFKNIQMENFALGTVDTSLAMVEDSENNSGGIRAYVYEKHYTRKKTMVEQKSLDSYFSDKDAKIDFIKIDVEGFECQVLLGAEKLLRKDNPSLFIEINEENLREQGYSAKELKEFLQKLGYNSFIDAATGKNISSMQSFATHMDIVCKKTER